MPNQKTLVKHIHGKINIGPASPGISIKLLLASNGINTIKRIMSKYCLPPGYLWMAMLPMLTLMPTLSLQHR